MNKLLIITVLVALLALSAESFRMPRQAEEEGTLSKISDTVKSYYNTAINSARGYAEDVKGLKLEEKASNLYHETTAALGTYFSIMQDQLYHILYQTQ